MVRPRPQRTGADPLQRRVLYVPGYDPMPSRRYREIYRREGAEQARLSGYRLNPAPRLDPTGFGWGVAGQFPQGETRVDVEVLEWRDVVSASMGHSLAATYGQMLRTAWTYIGSRALWRMMRLRRGPVLAALYPVAALLGQLAAAMLAGVAGLWAGLGAGAGWGGGAALGALAAAGALGVLRRMDARIHASYLMHDYAFTARDRGAYPAPLQARIAVFADRIAAVLAQDWDEVLVVGHSSGAHIAISALAQVVRSGRACADGRLALLTLGHVVPMVSFLPHAGQLRQDLSTLAAAAEIAWVDVSAPGDPCCFGLCDPVAVSAVGSAGQHNPLVLSAAFSRTLSAERRQALRGRWFRLHFQYLHAFDRPGAYDYFAITAGPLRLSQRYAGRKHSPGRIARPVNDWPGRARGAP